MQAYQASLDKRLINVMEQLEIGHLSSEGDLCQLKTTSDRLEKTTSRIENASSRTEQQLQSILAFQRRHENHLLSQSLDASSPEGRETWMKLGRLLRSEGIIPAMVNQNPHDLVRAMKKILQGSLASSLSDSYHTASEYFPQAHSHAALASTQCSIDILGSAPSRGPSGATFSDVFLERHKNVTEPLDQQENVENGISSLLQGMDGANPKIQVEDDHGGDEIIMEGF